MNKRISKYHVKNKKVYSTIYDNLERNNLLNKIPEKIKNAIELFKDDTLSQDELTENEKADAYEFLEAIKRCYISEEDEWIQSYKNDRMNLDLENKNRIEQKNRIEKEKMKWFKVSIPVSDLSKVKPSLKDLSDKEPDKYYRPPYPRNWYYDEKEGALKFLSINNQERASGFGNKTESFSPETMAEYVNVALKFFGYRCAFSGEEFTIFQNKTSNGVQTNLSVEHVLALAQGGDDIIGNIIATSLPYNISKNDHYVLEWWSQAKNGNGEFIYSPERLLKITYFMLKTLQMRDKIEEGGQYFVEEYERELFEKDSVLEYIQQIENSDPLKIISNYITDTERTVEEGKVKYSLESIDLEKRLLGELIPLKLDIQPTMKTFFIDALSIIERDLDIEDKDKKDEIIKVLRKMKNTVLFKLENKTHQDVLIGDEIRTFCKDKGLFLEKEDDLIIDELLSNRKYWNGVNEQLNDEEIRNIVNTKLENQYKLCQENELQDVIEKNPRLLVLDKKYVQRVKFWKENRMDFEELLSRIKDEPDENDEFIDVMIVLKKNGIVFNKKRMDILIIGDKETKKSLLYKKENSEKIQKELEDILGEEKYREYPISKRISDMKKNEECKNRLYDNLADFIDEKEYDVLFDKIQKSNKSETQNLIDVLLYLHSECGISFSYINEKNERKPTLTSSTTIDTLLIDEEKNKKVKEYIKKLTGVGKSSLLNIGKLLYNIKQNNYGAYIGMINSTLSKRDYGLSLDDIEALKEKVNPNSPWMHNVYYKAKKGTELKSYDVKNLGSVKSMDESVKNMAIQTDWLKDKYKDNTDIKNIDEYIDSITQISMFIADYIAIDRIKEETGKELTIEDEKCLIYFLMDQKYSNKIKIYSEDIPYIKKNNKEKEQKDAKAVFEIAIKNLKQDSRLEVEKKDIMQLLREYYKKVICKKIEESKRKVINNVVERS